MIYCHKKPLMKFGSVDSTYVDSSVTIGSSIKVMSINMAEQNEQLIIMKNSLYYSKLY